VADFILKFVVVGLFSYVCWNNFIFKPVFRGIIVVMHQNMVANRFTSLSLVLGLCLLFALPFTASAQKKKETKAKTEFKGPPEKILQQADALYAAQRFSSAKEAYVEVLKKQPENYHATIRAAKCSYFIQEYDDAANFFESAIDIDSKRNDTAYFELGMTYRILDRQNDALEMFTTFTKRWKEKDDYAKRAKFEIEGCKFVEEERKKEEKWRSRCLDLNSAMGDNFPAMLKQNEEEKFMVFTSSRPQSKDNEIFEAYNEGYSDLWMVKIEDDTTFGPAENMGKKVNRKLNDGNATFSPDGMTMYYSICNQGKLGYGCSIYESKYDPLKKAWSKGKLVEPLRGQKEVVVDSRGRFKKVPTYDVHPMLSADGNIMYFVSDRDGGQGRLDIWYSTYEGDKWGEPQNLGARINTPFDDICPFPSVDGKSLYFSSNGRVGYGGFDLYQSTGGVGAWGDPTNMGSPINSTYDDISGIWSQDDSSAYFASNRPGCTGRDDIYWVKKKPEPPCVFTVHGKVVDRKTFQPVPFATVILFEKDGETLTPVDTFTTDQTSVYNFEVDCERDYVVIGNAPEYLAQREDFSTPKDTPNRDLEMNLRIELERIVINFAITLNNIYYDYDKYFLRDSSKAELDRLIVILNENPEITIQMGSHTDTNGSEDYNKELSENRAKEAVKYLVGKGIAGDRLSWFGFGESQPLFNPEKSDEEEQANRRTEFRILSIDYAPAN
jgi:outer membrane protein OmpA-like peptidoglycan-associated protein/tetratricopeptide (TPR) repeat protein